MNSSLFHHVVRDVRGNEVQVRLVRPVVPARLTTAKSLSQYVGQFLGYETFGGGWTLADAKTRVVLDPDVRLPETGEWELVPGGGNV